MIINQIALRVASFPEVSETFIIDQAKLIVDNGYDLLIIVNENLCKSNKTATNSFQDYNFCNQIIELDNHWKLKNFQRLSKFAELLFTSFSWESLKLLNPFKYGSKALFAGTFFDSYDSRKYKNAAIVHVQFGYNITSLDKLKSANILNSKLLVTFHGFDAYFNDSTKDEKTKYYQKLFEVGDYYTCNTNYLKKYLLELGCPSNKLEVVHVPVNNDFFCPKPKSAETDKIILLSVGRLIQLKGHHHGIKVTKLLIDKGYDVIYEIIGDGPELDKLKDLALSLNIENRIIFLGVKSQDKVLEHMRNCDLFLMTSTSDNSGRSEAQGLVTIEAQACGKAVVAFRSGGVPDTFVENKTGFLCAENDLNSMMTNVEKLINDQDLREVMGRSAVDFVEKNYSYRIVSSQWKNIYSKLLSIK